MPAPADKIDILMLCVWSIPLSLSFLPRDARLSKWVLRPIGLSLFLALGWAGLTGRVHLYISRDYEVPIDLSIFGIMVEAAMIFVFQRRRRSVG